MIIDKEYPATHSMATSWFMVDLDGNVALIDIDDNGPVPISIPKEENYQSILFGTMPDDNTGMKRIPLTKEQAQGIISATKPVGDVTEAPYADIMVIDTAMRDRFIEIAMKVTKGDEFVCLSEEDGLYLCDLFVYDNAELEAEVLKLYTDKVILRTNYLDALDLFDNEAEGKRLMGKFPFFFYDQGYSNITFPATRESVPAHPFKEEQLSEKARKGALRIPVHFRDAEMIQLEEYYDCDSYFSEDVKINEGIYDYLPNAEGGNSFFRKSSVYGPSCGGGCRKCYTDGFVNSAYVEGRRLCDYPTGLIILEPTNSRLAWQDNDLPVSRKSVFIPYMLGIPSRKSSYMSTEDAWAELTDEERERFTDNCMENMEHFIRCYRPRVIIAVGKAAEVFAKRYRASSHRVTVEGQEYPFFTWEEKDGHMDEIMTLLDLPYLGKVAPRVISEEEAESVYGIKPPKDDE